MLVLSRRLGETIYVGEDVVVTVHEMLRHHVVMCLIAPANLPVLHRKRWLTPLVLKGGERFYTVSLSSMEGFRVGDIAIRVNFHPAKSITADVQKRFVRVAIAAPPSVVVLREEILHRNLAAGGRQVPPVAFSTWLRQAHPGLAVRESG